MQCLTLSFVSFKIIKVKRLENSWSFILKRESDDTFINLEHRHKFDIFDYPGGRESVFLQSGLT